MVGLASRRRVGRVGGSLVAAEAARHRAFTRFEHEAPNELWQMDFKGHFALAAGGRCHPLTVLDDHSRFALGLQAGGNEQGVTTTSDGCFEAYFCQTCLGLLNLHAQDETVFTRLPPSEPGPRAPKSISNLLPRSPNT